MRGYLGAVATRPRAGFVRNIRGGGPNLVLTRVVTAPKCLRYVIHTRLGDSLHNLNQQPSARSKYQQQQWVTQTGFFAPGFQNAPDMQRCKAAKRLLATRTYRTNHGLDGTETRRVLPSSDYPLRSAAWSTNICLQARPSMSNLRTRQHHPKRVSNA